MSESNRRPDQEAQKRRSTRIVQAVPLTVMGVDALGRPFQERTSTLIVNCHGARYQSKHYVLKNMWVTLEVPHNEPGHEPRTVRARVTWIQRPRTVRELFQIAVELETHGNVWGIAFPPSDWFPFSEPGSTPAAELKIPISAEIPQPASEEPHWAPEEVAPEEVFTAPAPEPAEDNLRVLPSPGSGDASQQLARQVARLVADARQEIQTTVRESATQAVAAETRPLLSALQTQMNEAAQKSVAAAVAEQIEKSQREVAERMEREQDANLASMREKLAGEMDLRLRDARQQFESQFEEVERNRRADFEQQLQNQLQAAVQRLESLSGSMGSSQNEVRAAIDQIRESSAKAAAEELRRWQEQMDLRTADAQARLVQMDQTARRLGEQIAAATAIGEVGWRGNLESELTAASARWQEKMEASMEDASRRASELVARNAETSAQQIEQQLQHRISMLGNAHSESAAQAENALQALRAEIDKESARSQETISRVQESVAQMEAKGIEFSALLTASEDWARRSEVQLESQSSELNRHAESAGQETLEKLAGELEQRLAPQITRATELLGQLQLNRDQVEKAVADHRQSIEDASRRAAELVARNAETSAQQVEQQLQQRISMLGNAHSQAAAQAENSLQALRAEIDKESARGEAAISRVQDSVAQLEAKGVEFSALLQAASEDWARRSEVQLESQSSELNRRAESAVTGMAQRLQPLLESAGQETIEKLAGELEQRLAPQISRATELLGQFQVNRDQVEKAVADHRQSIEDASRRAAELVARNAETSAQQIEQQLQQRISMLGNAHSQAAAQAENSLQALRAEIDKESARGEAAISRVQDSVAQLEAKGVEFSALLQAASEDWARRSEVQLESQSSELNRRAESAVTGMAQRLQPLLESAGQETIEKLAGELEQRLAPQISRATELLGQFQVNRDQVEKAVADHQQRIWQVSDLSLQETAARSKELLAKIEQDFGESARATSARWLTELETSATETSHSTFEALFKSADWYEKKFQGQMQTALEKGIDQAGSRLREKAAEMSGLFASELDHYSRSYVEHAKNQIKENARDAAENANAQIAQAGDAAAARFTERAAQLGQEQLDSYASKTKSAFDQNVSNMEAHTAQIRSKLESDTRGFAAEFQRALTQHSQQTLALGKQELEIQVEQAKDALRIESQGLERQFQSALNSQGAVAMDEYKERLENASNSWLVTTVTKLNQRSESLIDELAASAEKRLKAVCGNVFTEMGETLRQRLAGLTAAFGPPATPGSAPAAPPANPPEEQKK